jgi:serine/threonine protein kinase
MTAKTKSPVTVGTRIGTDLTVLGVVNDSGTEPVYIVWHHRWWCPMACKVVASARRAETESKIVSALAHPNIVRSFGVEQPNYLLMEFLEGPTLYQLAQSRPKKRLGISDALRVAIHLGSALRHIHERGFFHMDVKPPNIIVTHGRPVLVDFGTARHEADPRPDAKIGTAPYMAPEECQLDPITSAADVFGLGVTLFELVTGHLPFPSGTKSEPYMQLTLAPRAVRSYRSAVPVRLDEIIRSCLAREPAARPRLASLLPALHNFVRAGAPMWPAGFHPDDDGQPEP